MYPISAEVKALFDAEQRQVLRITGTDRNGTNILITDENVRMNGFSIDRYSCNGQKLEVGTAIASEMMLKLDNSDGQYNDVVFEGTELFVEVGVDNGTAITGINTDTLTVPVTADRFGYKWRCYIEYGESSAVNTNAVSIANLNSATFAIIKQPASINVLFGNRVTFSVDAIGSDLSYQWQERNENSDIWTNCTETGSNTDTLNFIIEGTERILRYYRCIVTDGNNTLTSNQAQMVATVDPWTAIIQRPSDVAANVGDTVTFHVEAQGENLTFKWMYSDDDGSTWNDIIDDTTPYIPCGYFTPDQQPRRLSTITIKAMDRMRTLDRMQPTPVPWTTDTDAVITDNNGTQIDFNAYVAFPTTIQNLVNQVCVHCGVTLATDLSVFPNYNYNLLKMPLIQQQFTYRNLIQWCAGFMGTNAWFDWNGQLRFSWYNNATGYETDVANRFSSDLYEDDIEITGVQYTNAQGIIIIDGSADYALELGDNLMMAEVIAEVLPTLNTALNGFTYRPMSAEVINAPYLWPMDVVTFEDKDGNTHTSVLTNVNFGINGATVIQSNGETEETNKYDSPTTMTPEQAKLINEAINRTEELDESLNQQGIFNRLTNNGEAQGIYLMNGKLYINMTYARSGTLVLGGLDNMNGVLQVLDSNENVICTIDQNGGVMNGTFTTSYLVEGNTSKIECRLVNGAVEVYHDGQYVGKLGMDVRNDTVYGEDVGVYAFGSGTSASISAGNTDSAIEPPAKVSTNSSGSVYITGSSMYVSEYPDDIPQQCYTGNIPANATLHIVNGLIVSYS